MPSAAIVSVAAPLREVENYLYTRLGLTPPSLTGRQDGEFLQAVRDLLASRSKDFLEVDFEQRVKACGDRPVINDDGRAAMLSVLERLKFVLVWVDGDRLASRGDVTPPRRTTNPHDALIAREDCTFEVSNTGRLSSLVTELEQLLMRVEEAR
ncbi:hypothetical protein ACFYL6_02175 [Micromonospora sp. NPDC007208]|uniref:hypothetical protein n=1 Tax=Micromonospora sp. NPDC007208 TaxID=3364236 RepID=UPI0036D0937D